MGLFSTIRSCISIQATVCKGSSLLRTGFILIFSGFIIQGSAQSEEARKVVHDLTAPEMQGRGYVNQGDYIAAEYIAEQFKKRGAIPYASAYFQPFYFPVNTFPDSMRVTVNQQTLRPGEQYIVHPASGSAQGTFTVKQVSYANAHEGLLRKHFNRKLICVVDPGTVQDKDSVAKLRKFAEALTDNVPVIWLEYGKLTWSVAGQELKNPFIQVKVETFDRQAKQVSLHIRNHFIPRHEARNVIAYIPGTDPDKKALVFSAHYDHIGRMGSATYFPGANDNASGTAMLLSLASYFKQHPPQRTLVFIAFAGEEAGLHGSAYYVKHPVFPLDQIEFLVNLDMIGTGDEGITVVNATLHPEAFDKLSQLNAQYDYLPQVKSRGPAANSDHYWFTKNGVPAFFIYTMGGSKAYHDIYDTGENLSLARFDALFNLLLKFASSF